MKMPEQRQIEAETFVRKRPENRHTPPLGHTDKVKHDVQCIGKPRHPRAFSRRRTGLEPKQSQKRHRTEEYGEGQAVADTMVERRRLADQNTWDKIEIRRDAADHRTRQQRPGVALAGPSEINRSAS
jgi:hypothetical protein